MDARTAQAMIRFGLGRRGIQALPPDPAVWLHDQLAAPDPTRLDAPPSTASGLRALVQDRRDKPPPGQSASRALYRAEGAAQLDNALTTPAPFRERLVWFWTNHFTVSLRRGACAAVAGAFVEEAVRPNVTGRFVEMLLAVMRHPAMLLYLDNAGSAGPSSPAGRRRGLGLNENLARECLELHTVSPASGYSQDDVTSFARILTGWSIDLQADPPGFRYRPMTHEPGAHTVMGQTFPDGEQGGTAALAFLANHPATHRHLATKLVRHFVADDPPRDAVRVVEGLLRDTHGDLGAATAALVDLPASWRPGTKLRTPAEFVVAAVRCLDPPDDKRPNILGLLALLGQPLWTAPAPNGWSDVAADWSSPEALLRRIDWASGFAGRIGEADVASLAEANLGELLNPATADAVRRAGSRHDAFTLLLASPDFQRR